jgi:hypothetical protein
MDAHRQIDGHEKVTAIFDRWPTFHDGEVVWLRLERGDKGSGIEPFIESLLHTWEMTSESDSSGYYVLRNHVLVHFRFEGIDEVQLQDFNHQNVLFRMQIEDGTTAGGPNAGLRVCLDASLGVNGAFRCRPAKLISVDRCEPDGSR